MKNKNCILLFAAASVACLMAAGCKKTEFSSREQSVPVKTVSISVTGDFNDLVSEEGASKAFVENIFRMKWQDGDTVFVFGKAEGADAISCLGKLGATTVEDTDNRLADLSGQITAPGEDTKLTLVYSPGLIDTPELESGALSISLASQGGAADSVSFVAYATVDYLGDADDAAYRTAFNFATSILRVNATGLAADAALAQASLTNVQTACILTIAADAAPAVSGDSLGTITRTFTENDCANSKGNAAFYLALPAITANDNRALTVSQFDGESGYLAYSYNGFAKGAAAAGRMLNSIATLDATDTDNYGNLSANGTANCYIVSEAGNYKLDATVKGNGTNTDGSEAEDIEPVSASILWETFGTLVKPMEGELVNNLKLKDGSLCFSAADKKGNALVAVKDAEGTILWSWHIWMTDTPVDQVYRNDAGTLMDRNLGATSADTLGGIRTYGLMYEWGRKDPLFTFGALPPSVSAAAATREQTEISTTITIDESVKNPTLFTYYNSHWATSGDTDLWGDDKTLYDPCPAGYKVLYGNQDGDTDNSFWKKAGFIDSPESTWNAVVGGRLYKGILQNSGDAFYPALGYRGIGEPNMHGSGQGWYWTSTAFIRFFCSNTDTGYTSNYRAAAGFAVRCQKVEPLD